MEKFKKTFDIVTDSISYLLIILLTIATILLIRKVDYIESKFNKEIDDIKYDNKELKEDNEYLRDILGLNETSSETQTYDVSAFEKIKTSDIASASKGKTIVVMIGREGCGWCAKYAPVLTKVQEDYHFQAKYINFAELVSLQTWEVIDEEAVDILMHLDAEEKYENFMAQEFGATPLTLFIKDNKIINAIAGYVDEEALTDTLEEVGFKK